MATFKDTKGREWRVEITHGDAKRLNGSAAKINLYAVHESQGELYKRLVTDPFLFGEVLAQLLKPQADAAGVTAEDFDAALDGEALDAALDAFDEALVVFSRNPAVRASMRRMIERKKALVARTEKKLVERADRAFEGKAQEAVDEAERLMDELENGPSANGSGISPTSAPASAGSIPTPSRSAS